MADRLPLSWNVVWSPIGFGNSTAKLVELRQAVKMDDPEEKTDVYFPVYVDHTKEKEIMVPLFPNYSFVRCRWHLGLEDRIRDLSGLSAVFLKPVGMTQPHALSEEEMERVRGALSAQIEMTRQWMHVGDLAIGDMVVIKSMGISGTILYFLPPNRAMIQTRMFNQDTPCPVKVTDLERA